MQIGRQRDAGGLEDAADLAGDGGAGRNALAVLLDGCFLQAVEIAQQIGPFDNQAVVVAQIGQPFCSIKARKEQKTWPADGG